MDVESSPESVLPSTSELPAKVRALPAALRRQLIELGQCRERDRRFADRALAVAEEYGMAREDPFVALWALLQMLSPAEVIDRALNDDRRDDRRDVDADGVVTAYHHRGTDVVRLERLLFSEKQWTRVLSGWRLAGQCVHSRNVVVKWVRFPRRADAVRTHGGPDVGTSGIEAGYYRQLAAMGAPLPWFSTDYRLWNDPVLVLEHMHALDPTQDHEYAIGLDVLAQLPFVHRIGVHSGIKPENIMKRPSRGLGRHDRHCPHAERKAAEGDEARGGAAAAKTVARQYFLIDFGNLATERAAHGYRRWAWSPLWTCQKREVAGQVTTACDDLFELGRVLYLWRLHRLRGQTLKYWSDRHSKEIRDRRDLRRYGHGRLMRFLARVLSINERRGVTDRDYKDLGDILSGADAGDAGGVADDDDDARSCSTRTATSTTQ